MLFFAPLFWPFWPPFGETVIGTGADAVTIFHQNNFNFTGPLILAAASFFWQYWGLAKKWFTGPKVQGTREELHAIDASSRSQPPRGRPLCPPQGSSRPEPT